MQILKLKLRAGESACWFKAIAFTVVQLTLSFAVLALLYCLPAEAREIDADSLVFSANESYQAGNFQEAASKYRKAIEAGANNGHIYYNYANSLYRTKEYGRAIANYRRALVQLPGSPDIVANLKLARSKVKDTLAVAEMSSLESTVQSLMVHHHLSEFSIHVMLLMGFTVFWLLIAAEPVFGAGKSDVQGGSSLRGLQIGLGAVLLLTAVFSLGTREGRLGGRVFALTPGQRAIRPAVVAVPEVQVRSGDSDSFQTVAVLKNGVEIEIDEHRGDWVEIILPEGRRGWAETASLELL